MPETIAQLDARLDEIETDLPNMVIDAESVEQFWGEFASVAESVEDLADEHTAEHVHDRITAILSHLGPLLEVEEAGRWRRLDSSST